MYILVTTGIQEIRSQKRNKSEKKLITEGSLLSCRMEREKEKYEVESE